MWVLPTFLPLYDLSLAELAEPEEAVLDDQSVPEMKHEILESYLLDLYTELVQVYLVWRNALSLFELS